MVRTEEGRKEGRKEELATTDLMKTRQEKLEKTLSLYVTAPVEPNSGVSCMQC